VKLSALFDINGHVAFVTGAADGLGFAFAEVMAENGATVVLSDIDGAALAQAVARLRAAGGKVEGVPLDIADTAGLRGAIDNTVAAHRRLDAVFANAGISSGPGFEIAPSGQIEALDPAVWERVIKVNLTATLYTMQFAARHMKPRRQGSIVAVTSIGGMRAEPMVGYPYVASKAAVGNLVRQMAVELAPHNVRVNAIAPGPFLTNIRDGRLRREPELVKQFAAMVPMGRIGDPDEIKGLGLLLASPAGRFITGTVIPIDGGTTAK
jgi:NAD(P)-dependent dehydrogenase (short-subunit alcohol dehydrogenase family)